MRVSLGRRAGGVGKAAGAGWLGEVCGDNVHLVPNSCHVGSESPEVFQDVPKKLVMLAHYSVLAGEGLVR